MYLKNNGDQTIHLTPFYLAIGHCQGRVRVGVRVHGLGLGSGWSEKVSCGEMS